MSKSSKSNGDGYKTVHSELSHGGFFAADNKVALPNYLVQLPSQNDLIMDIGVEEELNERGDCGDSDGVGDDARDFDDKMREIELERPHVLLRDEGIYKADEGGLNFLLLNAGDTMDPDEVKVTKAPDDWVDVAPNTAKREPNFDKVDSPDKWSILSYRHEFTSES